MTALSVRTHSNLNSQVEIWRYLDTPKALHYFAYRELYFCRSDKFQDKFEGSFNEILKNAFLQSRAQVKRYDSYEKFKRKLRRSCFINCWHKNQFDNMGMWKLYGKSELSIALKSTIGKLIGTLQHAKLPQPVLVSAVDYVDHHDPNTVLKVEPYANVFSYKNLAYAYENEVRAIIDNGIQDNDEQQPESIKAPAEPEQLLDEIIVHPEAPLWYFELIEKTMATFGITTPLKMSPLHQGPI